MQSVSTIISLWPSASELARDLGLKRESHMTVMAHRGRIPVRYWPRIVAAAKGRGIPLSYDDLVMAHATTEGRAA